MTLHDPVLNSNDPEELSKSRRRADLITIQTIARTIGASLDRNDTLNAICRAVVERLGVSHSGLVFFATDKSHGIVEAEYPTFGARGLQVPLAGIEAEQRIIAGKPVVVEDVASDDSLGDVRQILLDLDVASILIVPVTDGDNKVIGSFSLDSMGRKRQFTLEEVELCQTVAAQVSVAIENSELFEKTRAKVDQLAALQQTFLAITAPNQNVDLLNTIISQAVSLLGAKSGGIYRYNPELDTLMVVASFMRPHHLGKQLKVGEGMAGRLVQNSIESYRVPNYMAWEGKATIYADDPYPFGAVLEVPLKWEGKIIGVLYIDDDVGREFTETEANLLRIFADQAAIAIIHDELIKTDELKVKRLEQLTVATKEIMSNIGSCPLHELLNLIARNTVDILGAETCGVHLVKRTGFISLEASYGHRQDGFERGREFAVIDGEGTGLTGFIASQRTLFNLSGDALIQHKAVRGNEHNHTPSRRCYSLLAIPLFRNDDENSDFVGLLRADNKRDKNGQPSSKVSFTREDEWILQIFAKTIVVAIENARLLEEVNAQKEYLERLISTSPVGIMVLNRDGVVQDLNAQAEKIFDTSLAKIKGKNVENLYADPTEARRIGKLLRDAPDNRLVGFETTIVTRSNMHVPILLTATWLFDSEGERVGSVGYFEDLRRVKAAEQQRSLVMEASSIVANAATMDEGLQALARMIVDHTSATFCRIFLLDETGSNLVIKAAYLRQPASLITWRSGINEQTPVEAWPRMNEFLTKGNSVLIQKRGQRSQEILKKWSLKMELPQDLQYLFVVALRAGDHVLGLLDLGDVRQWTHTPFPSEEQELVVTIASQTAILIERMSLNDQVKQREKLLRKMVDASLEIRAETETSGLLYKITRLAAEVVNASAGALFLNRAELRQVELKTAYKFSSPFEGELFPYTQSLVSQVAQSGKSLRVVAGDVGFQQEILLCSPYHAAIAVPLGQVGDSDAILLLARDREKPNFSLLDLDIAQQFATHASIALRTSLLLDREQLILSQLAILQRVTSYIQESRDLATVYNVILTGVTAGYGLGFNRAALFLLDGPNQHIIGKTGIGYISAADAHKSWERDRRNSPFTLSDYIQRLELGTLTPTPIGQRLAGLNLSVSSLRGSAFIRAIVERKPMVCNEDEFGILPGAFIDAYVPTSPILVAPLLARDRVLGILVADNKFTQVPITPQLAAQFQQFANTVAVAIDNHLLLEDSQTAQRTLSAFFQASRDLVATTEPKDLLHRAVDQALQAAGADGVTLLLIDDFDNSRTLITAGLDEPRNFADIVRHNGLTMQVFHSGEPISINDTRTYPGVNPSLTWRKFKSAQCLPLQVEGQKIGVMWLHYLQSRTFSTADTKAVQLYANQASVAYATGLRIQELRHIRQAADALAGAQDLYGVLKQIVSSACHVLSADSAFIWSYDASKGLFDLSQSVSENIPDNIWHQFQKAGPRPSGTTFTVMQEGWISVHDINDLTAYPFLGPSTRALLHAIDAKSFQGFVLEIDKEILGVLYVNYKDQRHFKSNQRSTAQTFANHAAIALKRTRLSEQIRRIRDLAHLIAEVSALDTRDTGQAIVSGMQRVLGYDIATLYEYEPERQTFVFPPAMVGVNDEKAVLALGYVAQHTVVQNVLNLSGIHYTSDAREDAVMKGAFVRREGVVSSLGVPLIAGDQKVGVLFLNYRQHHVFRDEELTNVALLAHQAAIAIRNKQLLQDTRKRAEAHQALYEAGQVATQLNPLTDTLQKIMSQALRVVDAHKVRGCAAYIVTVDQGRLQYVASEPAYVVDQLNKMVGPVQIQKGGQLGITGRVAQTGQYLNVGNVQAHSDYISISPSVRSQLSYPLVSNEVVLGVITLEHTSRNAFNAEDLHHIGELARIVTDAIQKDRLYTQVAARTGLAWMGMLATHWRHTIEGHAATINVLADELIADPYIAKTPMLLARLSKIKNLTTKIMDKPISPPLTHDVDMHPVEIQSFLKARCTQLWSLPPYAETSLRFELEPTPIFVKISADWLRNVLDLVIDNAIKAMAHSEQKQLCIRSSSENDWLRLEIRDSGTGIPPEVLPYYLHQPIEKKEATLGLGIGGLMAVIILQTYGGYIEVEETSRKGTSILIRLPQIPSPQ